MTKIPEHHPSADLEGLIGYNLKRAYVTVSDDFRRALKHDNLSPRLFSALALVKEDAAIMLKENELGRFKEVLTELIGDKNVQEKMSQNIKKLALPNATNDIVDEIEKILK